MAPYWTRLGRHARGLVVNGRIGLIVYWEAAGVGELDEPGGEPMVTPAGFYEVRATQPGNHFGLLEFDTPDLDAFDDACEIAARNLDQAGGLR